MIVGLVVDVVVVPAEFHPSSDPRRSEDPGADSPRLSTSSVTSYASSLYRAVASQNWPTALKYLEGLHDNRRKIKGEVIAAIVNFVGPGNGVPILHRIAHGGAPPKVFDFVLSLGADVHAGATIWLKSGELLRDVKPFHLAALSRNITAAQRLCDNGADPCAQTGDGENALLLHLRVLGRFSNAPMVTWLLSVGVDPNATNRRGETCLALAWSVNNDEICRLLSRRGAAFHPGREKRIHTIWDLSGTRWNVTDGELLRCITERANAALPKRIYDEFDALRKVAREPYHLFLYLQAYRAAVERPHQPDQALTMLAPHLLSSYPPGSIRELIGAVDSKYDNTEAFHGYHQGTAEFLLLLNHPAMRRFDIELMSTLTLALTGITRFNQHKTGSITLATVHSWQKVGVLTFGFRKRRFDAMRPAEYQPDGRKKLVGESLLEQWGMSYSGPRPTDKTYRIEDKTYPGFGTGFVWLPGTREISYISQGPYTRGERRTISEGTYYESRRGYDLVSVPGVGTIVVRNSSWVFGRDGMKDPCYISEKAVGGGFKINDLFGLTQETLRKHFYPILSPEINKNGREDNQRLAQLLDELLAFNSDFAAWKFDTRPHTAGVEIEPGKPELLGGHFSPGFGAVVRLVEHFQRQAMVNPGGPQSIVPELAFCPPDYPDFMTFPFTDEWGEKQPRFSLTPDRIWTLSRLTDLPNALEERRRGKISDSRLRGLRGLNEDLRLTGARSFLQSGLNGFGELVMLAPEQPGGAVLV